MTHFSFNLFFNKTKNTLKIRRILELLPRIYLFVLSWVSSVELVSVCWLNAHKYSRILLRLLTPDFNEPFPNSIVVVMPLSSIILMFRMHRKSNKTIKKENFPQKICLACNRPFLWRKKWEKVWDDVKYCSDKCRNKR